MKRLVLLAFAIAACSAGLIKDPSKGYKEGDRFFYMPGDGDGILRLVDTEEPVDEEFIREYTRNPENNGYWLYTRANSVISRILIPGNTASVVESKIDFNKETIFLAHGWNGEGGTEMNKILTDAILDTMDVNVVVLDWSKLANRNYVTAKNGVPAVGAALGDFITWLTSLGADYNKIHLIGFSLGAHLVGNAGRATGGKVRRITGLDPAGPLWGRDSNRIVPSDGQYVEIIHTNTNFLGITEPCGDADFYPNGGASMPGCVLNNCSHGRAVQYMASSIRYNHFVAYRCNSLRDAQRNRCNGDSVAMGNADIEKEEYGIFRVNTGKNYPF